MDVIKKVLVHLTNGNDIKVNVPSSCECLWNKVYCENFPDKIHGYYLMITEEVYNQLGNTWKSWEIQEE